jgi:hypothetical protein
MIPRGLERRASLRDLHWRELSLDKIVFFLIPFVKCIFNVAELTDPNASHCRLNEGVLGWPNALRDPYKLLILSALQIFLTGKGGLYCRRLP